MAKAKLNKQKHHLKNIDENEQRYVFLGQKFGQVYSVVREYIEKLELMMDRRRLGLTAIHLHRDAVQSFNRYGCMCSLSPWGRAMEKNHYKRPKYRI